MVIPSTEMQRLTCGTWDRVGSHAGHVSPDLERGLSTRGQPFWSTLLMLASTLMLFFFFFWQYWGLYLQPYAC
jgi:hypothetical protein